MSTTAPTSERVAYPVAARELLRSTLLDAARDQLREHRWTDVKMADVALAAGVSRQTLYKVFGSRDKLAETLATREADRFLVSMEVNVAVRLGDPAGCLTSCFEVLVRAVVENPLICTNLKDDVAEDLIVLHTAEGKPLLERAGERLTQIIRSGWPPLALESAATLSECLVRLAVSYATWPAGTTRMSAASVAKLLGPYLEKLVAEAPARGISGRPSVEA